MLALWVMISYGMLKILGSNSLWVIKNSGMPVISILRTIFIKYCFYLNLKIFNVKIIKILSKRGILIELQSIAPAKLTRRLRLTFDCGRQKILSIARYRRLRQTLRYGFHLGKKIGRNRRYFCCKLPPIAPGGRTDTFSISTIINIDI